MGPPVAYSLNDNTPTARQEPAALRDFQPCLCPLWVKSGRGASGQVLFMSALPQKQTSECCRGMPALCQKRIAARQPLFVHLVGAGEQLSTWPLYTPI